MNNELERKIYNDLLELKRGGDARGASLYMKAQLVTMKKDWSPWSYPDNVKCTIAGLGKGSPWLSILNMAMFAGVEKSIIEKMVEYSLKSRQWIAYGDGIRFVFCTDDECYNDYLDVFLQKEHVDSLFDCANTADNPFLPPAVDRTNSMLALAFAQPKGDELVNKIIEGANFSPARLQQIITSHAQVDGINSHFIAHLQDLKEQRELKTQQQQKLKKQQRQAKEAVATASLAEFELVNASECVPSAADIECEIKKEVKLIAEKSKPAAKADALRRCLELVGDPRAINVLRGLEFTCNSFTTSYNYDILTYLLKRVDRNKLPTSGGEGSPSARDDFDEIISRLIETCHFDIIDAPTGTGRKTSAFGYILGKYADAPGNSYSDDAIQKISGFISFYIQSRSPRVVDAQAALKLDVNLRALYSDFKKKVGSKNASKSDVVAVGAKVAIARHCLARGGCATLSVAGNSFQQLRAHSYMNISLQIDRSYMLVNKHLDAIRDLPGFIEAGGVDLNGIHNMMEKIINDIAGDENLTNKSRLVLYAGIIDMIITHTNLNSRTFFDITHSVQTTAPDVFVYNVSQAHPKLEMVSNAFDAVMRAILRLNTQSKDEVYLCLSDLQYLFEKRFNFLADHGFFKSNCDRWVSVRCHTHLTQRIPVRDVTRFKAEGYQLAYSFFRDHEDKVAKGADYCGPFFGWLYLQEHIFMYLWGSVPGVEVIDKKFNSNTLSSIVRFINSAYDYSLNNNEVISDWGQLAQLIYRAYPADFPVDVSADETVTVLISSDRDMTISHHDHEMLVCLVRKLSAGLDNKVIKCVWHICNNLFNYFARNKQNIIKQPVLGVPVQAVPVKAAPDENALSVEPDGKEFPDAVKPGEGNMELPQADSSFLPVARVVTPAVAQPLAGVGPSATAVPSAPPMQQDFVGPSATTPVPSAPPIPQDFDLDQYQAAIAQQEGDLLATAVSTQAIVVDQAGADQVSSTSPTVLSDDVIVDDRMPKIVGVSSGDASFPQFDVFPLSGEAEVTTLESIREPAQPEAGSVILGSSVVNASMFPAVPTQPAGESVFQAGMFPQVPDNVVPGLNSDEQGQQQQTKQKTQPKKAALAT